LLNWLNFNQLKNPINISDLEKPKLNINDLRGFLKIVIRKFGYLWKKIKIIGKKMFFRRKSYCHAEKKMLLKHSIQGTNIGYLRVSQSKPSC
jgi:hypothetical protein